MDSFELRVRLEARGFQVLCGREKKEEVIFSCSLNHRKKLLITTLSISDK